MQKIDKNIEILACGLNYYRAHRFRSKVVVEFGKPFTIPPEIREMYKHNKREAIQEVILEVEQVIYKFIS
jgi:glycerol-3-phosphate O-acyltransferase/dihydroxyacetone phosphate acyltransferase